jgi:hypothetical protein
MANTKLLGLVAAAVATYGVWHWHHRGAEPADEASAPSKLVVDRLWIDHMPKSETDPVNVFLLVDDAAVGVFQKSTMWVGQYEMFQFELNKDTLRVRYPQTREREDITTTATECKQRDWDYCLELKNSSRGVTRYVSRKGWEIDANSTKSALEQAEAIEAKLGYDPE